MSATYIFRLAPGESERLLEALMPHFTVYDEKNKEGQLKPSKDDLYVDVWVKFNNDLWDADLTLDYNSGNSHWAEALIVEMRERFIITRIGHCSSGWWDGINPVLFDEFGDEIEGSESKNVEPEYEEMFVSLSHIFPYSFHREICFWSSKLSKQEKYVFGAAAEIFKDVKPLE